MIYDLLLVSVGFWPSFIYLCLMRGRYNKILAYKNKRIKFLEEVYKDANNGDETEAFVSEDGKYRTVEEAKAAGAKIVFVCSR